jgi:hypothetical protein
MIVGRGFGTRIEVARSGDGSSVSRRVSFGFKTHPADARFSK